MMNRTIIQEAEFKAGEYGELVVAGQPLITSVFFDFYPKGIYGEPKDRKSADGAESPSAGEPKVTESATKTQGQVVEEPRYGEDEAFAEDVGPEGLAEAFAEPRIVLVLYCSNNPRAGEWKRVGEFKAHIYTREVGAYRFYRIIHPADCPFEGKVVVVGKSI